MDKNTFDKKELEHLLEKMIEISEMSLFFMDVKGRIVVSKDKENCYCNVRKRKSVICQNCNQNLAVAAAKAAINNEPVIFCCSEKMVNMVLPIVVNNQYVGALAGGKIRCEEENAFPKLFQEKSEQKSWQEWRMFMEVPILSRKKIIAMSELFFLWIEGMGQKQDYQRQLSTLKRNKKHLNELRQSNAFLKDCLKRKEKQCLKAKLFPQILLNFFVTVSNYAILEDAFRTEEVIVDLASIFRYYLDENCEEVLIKQELEQIDKYLKTLKNQYEGRLDYIINCKENVEWKKIPILSIFPFVEYVLHDGILPGHFKGKLYLDVELIEGRLIFGIQLQSTEYILSGEQKKNTREYFVDDALLLQQSIDTEKRLSVAYDGDCQIEIYPNMVKIDIPENKKNRRDENDKYFTD